MADVRDPQWKDVEHLARDLILAQGAEPSWGRAIFLIGAGCSVSVGIPAAQGVARKVACHLACKYSQGLFDGGDPDRDADEALAYLVANGHVDPSKHADLFVDGRPAWGALYQYLFAEHLKSPNQQRDMIYRLVKDAKGSLNWAHACLGELVKRRFVNTVLTTNFDQLVLTGIFRAGLIPVVADGLSTLNRIVAEPLAPQVIHLHGSMHTYALRNSPTALAEPLRDPRAVSMLNGILQRADVLVVVGYAGGEEGLMDLLLEASISLEQLVVYWVTYENDPGRLSPRCRRLLSGENKFAINGGEADRFFGDLMARLRIGQPEWMAHPLEELERLGAELVDTPEIEEVSILIRRFRARVTAVGQQEPPEEERLERAARLRAAGDYAAARIELEGVDPATDPQASRLHALNALSMFEEAPESHRGMLDAAAAEFGVLIDATSGRERVENVLSLLDALFDMFEAAGEVGDADVLTRIVDVASTWIDATADDGDPTGHGRLLFYRAQAHHRRADAAGEDEAGLELAIADYRAALADLARSPDRSLSILEVQEGLAAALQVLAARRGDVAMMREAVQLFREVADNARRSASSPEDGGLLYNLSGALITLLRQVDKEEADKLAAEAREVLERSAHAYSRSSREHMLGEVRSRLDEVDDLTGRTAATGGFA